MPKVRSAARRASSGSVPGGKVFGDLLIEVELQFILQLFPGPITVKQHLALHEKFALPAHGLCLLHDEVDGPGETGPVGSLRL